MIDNYSKQINGLGSVADKSMSWLKENSQIYNSLNKALLGSNQLQFAIPIFGGSGDNFKTIDPWHHVFFEAEQDLDSAILLLLSGFYKDSFRAMRSFLELHIFALYNFVNEDKDNFKNWLEGKNQTPKLYILLQALDDKSEGFKKINKELNWSEEVKLLYKELSGFMHTQGALHTHTSLRNSNQTVFSDEGIKLGSALLLRAIRLTSAGFVVNFPMSLHPLPLFNKFAFSPPAGGFLDDGQVDDIKSIFQDDVAIKLSEISLSNEDSVSLVEGIKSMPDLTEQEVLDSFKKVLESEEFKNSRQDILEMIKNDEFGKAIAIVVSTQRAMMRAINGILFNPFYDKCEK